MGVRKGYKQTPQHIERMAAAHRKGKFFQCPVCGKDFWRTPSIIAKGYTKACSRQCYNKYKTGKSIVFKNPRPHLLGENNPNWKGGISLSPHRIARGSGKMKKWRKYILERDNYTCNLCGFEDRGNFKKDLQVDHIKPFAQHPELRLEVTNGRVLCISCHKAATKYFKINKKPLYKPLAVNAILTNSGR